MPSKKAPKAKPRMNAPIKGAFAPTGGWWLPRDMRGVPNWSTSELRRAWIVPTLRLAIGGARRGRMLLELQSGRKSNHRLVPGRSLTANLIRRRRGRDPLRYCPHIVTGLAVRAKLMVGRTTPLQDELAVFNFAQAPQGQRVIRQLIHQRGQHGTYFYGPVPRGKDAIGTVSLCPPFVFHGNRSLDDIDRLQ